MLLKEYLGICYSVFFIRCFQSCLIKEDHLYFYLVIPLSYLKTLNEKHAVSSIKSKLNVEGSHVGNFKLLKTSAGWGRYTCFYDNIIVLIQRLICKSSFIVVHGQYVDLT